MQHINDELHLSDKFFAKYKTWPYSNTAILVISLVIFFIFADHPIIKEFLRSTGDLGYLGAMIAGMFFVSVFTVAPAAVILFDIASLLNPIAVAILAGIGAVIGDYIIFRFMKDKVFLELKPVFDKIGGSFMKKIFLTPYFAWLIPIFGAFVIASPFPDEVGITMMGISRIKAWQFILVTFILNAVGIFILVSIASI